MLIKEIMNTDVCECTEDTPLAEVYELVQSTQIGYAVIVDSPHHRVPIGIVNEHSICESIVKKPLKSKKTDAGSVMSPRIQRIHENTEIEDCKDLLTNAADAIVVVNDRRQFCGVVDTLELESAVRREARTRAARMTFSEIIGNAIPAAVEIPAFGWLK
jgi:predicted transcriptional regulator